MRDAIHLALDYMKGMCATCTVKGAKRDKKVHSSDHRWQRQHQRRNPGTTGP